MAALVVVVDSNGFIVVFDSKEEDGEEDKEVDVEGDEVVVGSMVGPYIKDSVTATVDEGPFIYIVDKGSDMVWGAVVNMQEEGSPMVSEEVTVADGVVMVVAAVLNKSADVRGDSVLERMVDGGCAE